MALLLSTTCISKSVTQTNPKTHFKSSPFSLTKTFNTQQPAKRARKISPLQVAAPPSQSTPSVQKEEEEGYGVDDESGEEVIDSKFTWRDHWYPVSLLEDLDPLLPTPFQLLGRDLVLWFDKVNQEWVAFDDKCPHRLAPLSEGRIDENGHLQCSYHGWSFDGCGSCTRIPQALPEGPEARAVKSPRACATRFPAMVSQGLLFVWPDENGWERAQATKPPMLPDDFNKPEFSTVTIQRDLFYGYDTLMENVSDPSHIDFAHHKVTGRRDRAKPLQFKLDSSGPWGFGGANDGNPRITAEFVAPCYYINKVEIDTKLPVVGDQKWIIWICSFNVPMAPGKTRSIVCSARNFFQFTMPGPAWWQVIPRWHEHWTSNKVYDGDMIVLQGQEKTFLSQSMGGSDDINKQYTKLTFTPTQSDRFVLEFRSWLRRHGNSKPEWFGLTGKQPLPSTVLSKREMLDRFEQHTQKCSSCKKAYTSFQTLQKFSIGATIAFCATVGIPSDVHLRVVLAALALASASLAYALNQLEKNFVFVDYVHAEID
ncbi:IRON-SULFUR DOMAIN CONTAINING PROTEIN [Salix viminalis]|uniref:IRON-SULFUR DOMAIN CONTAINING PROTEIN n=1 Tax=Salix viminalis TaxID=40686 RepID=A0A9Q0TC67_SALVM|nr:IRON-SULFUR DOMAIN CONTAINING PROTEIN [Salix viminalis]